MESEQSLRVLGCYLPGEGLLEIPSMFCCIKSRDRKEIGTSSMVGRRMFSRPFAEGVARCSGNLGLLVVFRIGANCVGLQ